MPFSFPSRSIGYGMLLNVTNRTGNQNICATLIIIWVLGSIELPVRLLFYFSWPVIYIHTCSGHIMRSPREKKRDIDFPPFPGDHRLNQVIATCPCPIFALQLWFFFYQSEKATARQRTQKQNKTDAKLRYATGNNRVRGVGATNPSPCSYMVRTSINYIRTLHSCLPRSPLGLLFRWRVSGDLRTEPRWFTLSANRLARIRPQHSGMVFPAYSVAVHYTVDKSIYMENSRL